MNKNSNKKIPKNLVISTIIAFAFSIILYFIIPGHIQYGEIDDYIIALLLQKADFTDNLFISYFISIIIIKLQKYFTTINLYVAIQIILSFLSMIAINYTFFKKFKFRTAILFVCIIDMSLTAFSTAIIQYTQTSAIATVAGLLLIISSTKFSENTTQKLIQRICGVLLIFSASLFRFEAFVVVSVIFFVFVFMDILVNTLKTHKDNTHIELSKIIVNNIKGNLALILTMLIAVSIPFAVNIVSETIKSQNEGYTEYKEYNDARCALIDYEVVPYEGNEEFYNSIDIYSQSDINIFMAWNGDEQFFNTEKLHKIANYQANKVYGNHINPGYIINNLVAGKLRNMIPVNPYIIIALGVMVGIATLILIYKIRNHIKYLFPIALLFVWIIYFYFFRTPSGIFIMTAIAISVITAFFFNRYHFINVLSFNIIMFMLSLHLNLSRINFRAIFIYISAIICILLYLINFNNLQNKFKSNKVFIISFIILLLASTFTTSLFAIKTQIPETDTDNKDIISYFENHENNQYIILNTRNTFYPNYYEPLKPTYIPDNVILAGGWYIGSSYTNNLLQKNDITNIYKDIVDEKNKSLITTEYRDIGNISEYINSHYSEANQEIEFKLIDNQAGYKIYHLESVIK